MKFFKNTLSAAILAAGYSLAAANLLTNSSFEEELPLKKGRWQIQLVKDWECELNSGVQKCDISLASPGFSGRQALRLHTLGKQGFCSANFSALIPASAGQEVSASVMMRGKGNGYIRIYYYDAQKQPTKKYMMLGRTAREKWEKLVLKFTIPAGVSYLRYSLQTLKDNADVYFDDAVMEIAAGDVLENGKLRVAFNPRVGGCVDSFYWKPGKFEFTTPNRLGAPGGMFSVVLPAGRMPGELSMRRMERADSAPGKRVYRARLETGKFSGLEVTKTYELLPEGLLLTLSLKNNSPKAMEIDQRIQSFVSSAPGVYSWPTPDWVTIFRQTGAPRNGLNAVVQDLFRAGWEAKYYTKLQAALCFEFDSAATRRLYCYFSTEPNCSTMEWYLKPFTLAPGKEASRTFRAVVSPGKAEYYADPYGKKQRVEKIEPIKMPEPPPASTLPPVLQHTFIFSAGLGNLHQPEMAGYHTNIGFAKLHKILNIRLARILADSYFTAVAPGRMNQDIMLKAFRDDKGRNCIGEMARRYGFKIFLGHLFSRRDDVDVDKYMKEKWPAESKWINNPEFLRFIREYHDVVPVHFTGDELLPQNVDVLLKIHEEMKKYLPEDVVPFPYLNSSSTDFIPYVPIFIGDWYPIKRAKASGRNPWSVYPEFTRIVRLAGAKPVWFMPQGFSDGPGYQDGIYAFPTAGEMRLMLYLAASAGVKGVAWHGFASGTWPWMMNYHMYRYSPLGGAGQITPSWAGIVDAARTFATVGPLLMQAKPAALPAGARVECGKYRSPNGFYDGAAIRLFALQLPKGTMLIAVNQNPESVSTGKVTFPAGKVFDLSALKECSGGSAALRLAPGDAVFYFCGKELSSVDEAFRSRFQAELRRYRILADQAGAGIAAPDVAGLAKLPPRTALEKLFAARAELQKKIDGSARGRVLKEMASIKNELDALDFRLCCARELVVTPEMWKGTRRYARWIAHPDPAYQKLREKAAGVFADFYRLYDLLAVGQGVKEAEGALPQLRKEADSVCSAINSWLDHHPRKAEIDDPYAY